LTCYEKCTCDASYYKYNRSNCASPKVLGGESCSLVYVIENDSGLNTLTKTAAAPTTSANTGTPSLRSTASVSASLDTRIQASLEDERNRVNNLDSNTYYSSCTCPAEYNLSVCPTGANCIQCDSKYKFVDCKEGYTASGNTCVKTENCSAYPLTVCPTGGICSKCPDNNAKLKLDSCDTSKGWKLSGNTCAAVTCPAGYTAGVTSCSDTTTSYSSNGYSGGRICGKCTTVVKSCKDYNSNYMETNECKSSCQAVYPLGFDATTHAPKKICLIECDSRYYTVVDASTTYAKCVAASCESGGYLSSIPSGKGCATISYAGRTCYKDCSKKCNSNIDCYMKKDDGTYCTLPADGATVCNGKGFATSANCSIVVSRLADCRANRKVTTSSEQPTEAFCGNYFTFQSLVCDTATHRCVPEKCNWDKSGCQEKCSTYADYIYFAPQSGMDCSTIDPSATGGRVCYRCTKSNTCTSKENCKSVLSQTCGTLETDCIARNSAIFGHCKGAAQAKTKDYTEAYCSQKHVQYNSACNGHANDCYTCSSGKCVAKTFNIKDVVPDYSGYYDSIL